MEAGFTRQQRGRFVTRTLVCEKGHLESNARHASVSNVYSYTPVLEVKGPVFRDTRTPTSLRKILNDLAQLCAVDGEVRNLVLYRYLRQRRVTVVVSEFESLPYQTKRRLHRGLTL